MNNELHLAYQIKQHLNGSLRALPDDKIERLRAARERALANQRKAVVAPVLQPNLQIAGGASGAGAFGGNRFEWLGQLMPVLIVAVGLVGISVWHDNKRALENADLDVQMLIDELPPSVYADKGFAAWIKRENQ